MARMLTRRQRENSHDQHRERPNPASKSGPSHAQDAKSTITTNSWQRSSIASKVSSRGRCRSRIRPTLTTVWLGPSRLQVIAAEQAYDAGRPYYNKLPRFASVLATKYCHGRNRLNEVIAGGLSNMRMGDLMALPRKVLPPKARTWLAPAPMPSRCAWPPRKSLWISIARNPTRTLSNSASTYRRWTTPKWRQRRGWTKRQTWFTCSW